MSEINNEDKLIAYDLSAFLELEFPPREIILSPWLPTAGLAMLHAKPGIGKTHVSLNVAHAIARGGSFLAWKAKKAYGVLLVDGEMYPADLQERLTVINKTHLAEPLKASLRILSANMFPSGIPDLATKEGQDVIENFLTSDIKVLILDNLSSLVTSGNENEAESWQLIQKWLLRLRGRGISVLLIHHSGKKGDQRGTSKRNDILDSCLRLERPDDYTQEEGARFVVRYDKARNFSGDDARPIEARLRVVNGIGEWSVKLLTETTYEKALDLYNEGYLQVKG